jgi:hypothetical protein
LFFILDRGVVYDSDGDGDISGDIGGDSDGDSDSTTTTLWKPFSISFCVI